MFLPEGAGVNPTPRIWAVVPGLSPRCCGIAVAGGLDESVGMTPQRAADPALWPPILALLHQAFAYMEGRIDPPSSLRDLTPEALTKQAAVGEIWLIGAPVACVFLTPKPGVLYVGKLAVADVCRGQGLARALMGVAEARAREMRLPALELQVRVELVENQAAFRAMGFQEVGRTAHKGYDRPTSITYRRAVF
jgi:ribosomal protein S18 acetylase RimI-like enzyme